MALSVRGDEIAMTGFSIFSVTSKAKSSANNNTQKVCNSKKKTKEEGTIISASYFS